MKEKTRCAWSVPHPLMIAYHDEEWGVPVHDDEKHYEYLLLDAMQAGLSWLTVLKKRDAFRSAFSQFNPKKVASYAQRDINILLRNAEIIRNRQKINAAIINAQRFLQVQREFGSFNDYIWQFTNVNAIRNRFTTMKELPPKSAASEAMSRDLIKRGFSFVGPTICYAYMQAAGMVNDHTTDCFRYRQVK